MAPHLTSWFDSGKAYHYLEAPVEIGGKRVTVGVMIREDTAGNLYYNHSIGDEEAAPPSRQGSNSKAGPPDEGGGGVTRTQKVGGAGDGINLDISGRMAPSAARGKIRLTSDGRAVITLMKDANASTFLHETGHDWLEQAIQTFPTDRCRILIIPCLFSYQ